MWTWYSSDISLASFVDCSAVKVVGWHNNVQPLFSAILIWKIARQQNNAVVLIYTLKSEYSRMWISQGCEVEGELLSAADLMNAMDHASG